MSFYSYTEPEKVDVITADNAVIDNAKIIRTQDKLDFKTLVFVFLAGALSFAVALSFNNFAQEIINKYSIVGSGVSASLINLIVFTISALIILYLMWRAEPKIASSAVNGI